MPTASLVSSPASPFGLWASQWRPARPNGLTFIDFFCGAGGSAIGLTAAGFELKLAANHWQRAIETHAANFTAADHLCADINNHDMRRLPPADVLWASPICTEASPSGGKKKRRGQLTAVQASLFDDAAEPVPDAGWERTRATCYDVLRAAEIWKFKAILIENVMELATDWPLFCWWLEAFTTLGYRHQIVCVNSAHIGAEDNPHAPQWRDRLYIVFLLDHIPMPDLEPRPLAYCPDCGRDVHARQSWKQHLKYGRQRIGKYRDQYLYTCPNTTRPHRSPVVEPYVLPARAAIDWTDLGERIGDKKRPLAATTMHRIGEGLRLVTGQSAVIQVNHAGHDGRAYAPTAAPLAARTVRGGDGIATPPLLVPVGGTWNMTATTVGEPMRTRTANPKGMEALVAPADGHTLGAAEPFVAMLRNHGTATSIREPLATLAAGGNHHALVVPYRNAKAKTTAEPLHTVATIDSAALVQPAIAVEDCFFRMLQPREHLRAQRFPDFYQVTGNKGEQTMQAGNAVSSNVAQWLGERIARALCGR
ncbi:DNA cytosine methyltransferase [Streptosporangiaceae bacterium NEAU-GS5]|nr:DNA cytosine methyltransferase [Streptosporangiaceae bacterium NEAU-GS5]